MSPTASTPDVLDLLVEQYQAVPAPAPSLELLARMDAGRVGSVVATDDRDDDREATAVVIPFAPRPRMRVRYLIAATVATFVAMSGLAVAGVLPDGLQRQVASVASEFGIDLPSPDTGSTPADSSGSGGGQHGDRGTSGTGSGGTSNSSGSKSGGGAGAGAGTPTTSSPRGSGAGGAVDLPLDVPPTTLPPGVEAPELPPITLPPVTTPPILGLPPITLAPVTLPPLSLPPLTLPPISLPPLTLPPLGLPGL
jgi:hypothetical protein